MNFDIRELASAFIVLFAIIDISGSIPIILDLKSKGRTVHPERASLYSFLILLAFFFVGDWILGLFNVDISSFAIAGSLVIFVVAVEMTFGIEVFKLDGPGGSATIIPIVFPLIAGPAAFTALLSIKAEYSTINILLALLLNILVVYLVLKKVGVVGKIFGPGGIYVLRKFFGIILLAISVKLFISNIAILLQTLK